jgi:DNA-binding NarL/FixJ family response regulator
MKILVVDDHELIREALHGVLKELKRDVIVLEAVDSRQAMQYVSEQADIGLILLDLNLPDRDGFSVLSASHVNVVQLYRWCSCQPSRTETVWSRHWTWAPSVSFRSPDSAR